MYYLGLRAMLHDGRVPVTMKLWGPLKLIWRPYHGNWNWILCALKLQCEVPPHLIPFQRASKVQEIYKISTLCTQTQAWSIRKKRRSMMSWGMWVLFGSFFIVLHLLLIRLCCTSKSTIKRQQIRLKIRPILIELWLLGAHVCWVLHWIHRSSQLCSLLSVE